MEFNSLIPELSVTDINKSKDFYLSLGFEIKYERPENKFIFLQLGENQIMIEEVHTYKCDDVEYSDSEFLLQAPDGYLLRFNN